MAEQGPNHTVRQVSHSDRSVLRRLPVHPVRPLVNVMSWSDFVCWICCACKPVGHVVGNCLDAWREAAAPWRGWYFRRTSDQYRAAIRRKRRAHPVYVQLGCIAQGLLIVATALRSPSQHVQPFPLRMWSGITPRFAPRSWDARLGARRAV